jgi:hypothetical protein
LSSGNWHFQIIIFQTELQVWQIGNLVQKQDDLLLCFLPPDPSGFAVASQEEGCNLTPQM